MPMNQALNRLAAGFRATTEKAPKMLRARRMAAIPSPKGDILRPNARIAISQSAEHPDVHQESTYQWQRHLKLLQRREAAATEKVLATSQAIVRAR